MCLVTQQRKLADKIRISVEDTSTLSRFCCVEDIVDESPSKQFRSCVQLEFLLC